MKTKGYIITIIITLIVSGLFTIEYLYADSPKEADSIFKVYLKGEELGYISNDADLYNLINEEQKEIKNTYEVDNVYPPSDFEIVKTNTYNENIVDINTIYNQIEEYDNFTIKGYTVTIKYEDEDREELVINVLNKEIFDEAINTFVTAFIEADIYSSYMDGTQEEIIDYGEYIEKMYFVENISIKENYISVNDKIFTNSEELSQHLLFGPDAKITQYTVTTGDTISSIANANKLNSKEFLVANPELRNPDTLLAIGSKVNVTLLNPIINFIYEIEVVEEVEIDFITATVVDNTKAVGYSEPTVAGVPGLQKVTKNYAVVNGLASKEVEVTSVVIREAVNAVNTVGPSYVSNSTMADYVYTGFKFALPTVPGVILTSPFNEWRSGYAHKGTDYSNGITGSPIYAITDGVVTQAGWGSGGQGNYVVISHGKGYYSNYLHMATGTLRVKVGDTVTMGQQIGGMGNTGWSEGTHLHIEFTYGEPYRGNNIIYYNAHKIIYGG